MQALAVYVIFRLDEGTPLDFSIDGVLLRAVTLISIQLMAMSTASNTTPSPDGPWRDWIMEESGRRSATNHNNRRSEANVSSRLCAVFQIIGMLVHFEPAKLCEHESDVVLAPLPAPKRLWEATDEHAWKLLSDTEREAQLDFGLTKNGDLVKLREQGVNWHDRAVFFHGTVSSQNTVKWNEWCSGMDGIGNLVMLAASLIQ